MNEYSYYVGGESKQSNKPIEVVNPATEEAFALIFETTKKDLQLALSKAQAAQRVWRQTSFPERARIVREIAKIIIDNLSDLASLETQEIGKPLKESLFIDIPLGAESFNYYASFLESLEEECMRTERGVDAIRYEPFGVCGVYLPFNTPLMIFGFSCAASLAAGNALIIKPSEYGSLSLLKLASLIDTLDIPPGLINIVSGKGETIGRYLSESDLDLISFTGSRHTLKKLIAQSADNPKKIICELGGCNLTVIFSDANKEDAVDNLLGSSFIKQGQMCIGTSVALIEESIYDEVIEALIDKVGSITLGDPFDSTVGMGPLVSKQHLQDVDQKVRALLKEGATILRGGVPLPQRGYFYPPTLIAIEEMVYQEFFAPVILIKKFKAGEIEDLVRANTTGLVMQIWSQDLHKAYHLADQAECGTVWINTFAQLTPQTPFGGTKQSGWGRNLGKSGFFEYVQPKHIGIGFSTSPVKGWFGI